MLFIGNVFGQQKSSLSVKKVDVNKNVHSEIKNFAVELEKMSLEIEELKKRVNSNAVEIKDTGSSVVELNRKIERLNNDIINLMSRVETLSKDVSDLKVQQLTAESKSVVQEVAEQTVLSQQPQKPDSIKTSFEEKQLMQEISDLKKELKEVKENQNISTASDIKDPNLRRVLTSPYLTVTSVLISIIALIATF